MNQPVTLGFGEAEEGEEASLLQDEVPVSRSLDLNESVSQQCPHACHSVCDFPALVLPFLPQLRITEDDRSNLGSMLWRGGVACSDDDLHLRKDSLGDVLVLAHNVSAAYSFSVESEALGH